ncbi:M56 family metallopeptidase [Gimesia aquarii]|uniref:Regulatory protein BlaR1 n=1 Tax=Gimesia aquarii TaxID=2527964 RepID=A0A517WNZ2_9PLAN|nr:M56 family metallopeptidase [Gimesia aquarii]QDU06975.1 Regulatory protein BlaR1 [Gimesia aquarii]
MIWQNFIDPALSTRICLTLVHSVWQMAALLFIVWCSGLIWKNRTVETSYTMNVAALLVGLLALPITFLMVDVVDVPEQANVSIKATADSPATPPSMTPDKTAMAPTAKSQATGLPLAHNKPTGSTSTSDAALATHSSNGKLFGWLQYMPWVVAFYLAGVVIMLARLGLAMIKANQLGAQAMVIKEGPLVESLQSLANQWSMKIVPTLAYTEQIMIPTVIGLIRPMILIPASILSGLTTGELDMFLKHELAHVRRYDMWVNLLQRLAETILFFNPVLWYLSRRISTLREFCCDEITCQEDTEPNFEQRVQYATALLRVVELSNPNFVINPDLASLAASGRSPSEVRRRVARLFGEPLREPIRFSRSMALSIAATALLLVCGPTLWSTYAKVNQSPEPIPQKNKIATTDKSTKPFSFGSKVEVLSIGTYNEKPQRWWNSKGTLLPSVPYHIQGAQVAVSENQIGRQLVFRISNLPTGCSVKWKLSNTGSSANGEVVLDGVESPPGYRSQIFNTRKGTKSFDLSVGVASSQWTTVSEANSYASSTATRDNQGIIFSGAFIKKNPNTKKEELVTVVTHSLQKSDVRVIAVDSQGKTHTASKSAQQYAGGTAPVHQTRWYFRNLELKNFDHFEFQKREFEWVELKDLPLYPSETSNTLSEKKTTQENSETSTPVKHVTPEKLPIVVAKHVLLLNGNQIITWNELEQKFAAMPDPSSVRPAFYITRGATEAGLYKTTKAKIWELHRKFKLGGHSEGSLWPRTDFRYDHIKTVDDLRPDPALKFTGTILNSKGEPVEGAEVVLIKPVDKSISYKTYHMALVQGRIRNRLEHIMTLSDSNGQFELYPPKNPWYYIVALHPKAGFSLNRSDWILPDKKLKLLPWSGLKTNIDEVPNETQTVSLRTQIEATEAWPEIILNQYWSDLPKSVQTEGFQYQHIPPINRTTISRSFRGQDGGSFSIPGASVSLLPGEIRELGLGPLSKQQSLQLNRMRESSRKRRELIDKKLKGQKKVKKE